jgi:hypothetical protein
MNKIKFVINEFLTPSVASYLGMGPVIINEYPQAVLGAEDETISTSILLSIVVWSTLHYFSELIWLCVMSVKAYDLTLPSKCVQAIMLLTGIWKAVGSYLGQGNNNFFFSFLGWGETEST